MSGMKRRILKVVFTYTTTNSLDCDSTATLNLTIYNSSSSSTDIIACDNYEWNGGLYNQSGIYSFETQTINGCDSIANLNFDIKLFSDHSIVLLLVIVMSGMRKYTHFQVTMSS